MYAVVVRPELYSTESHRMASTVRSIGYLISRSSSSLAGLVISFIPTHLDLYFCDERHELIGPGTQERVECAGFVHSKNIQ